MGCGRMTEQPAGNYYDKYRTRNPVARWLMRGFLDAFDELAGCQPARIGVEIGCGEGELSIRLARAGFRMRGFDIAQAAIVEARARAAAAGVRIDFARAGIDEIEAALRAPLVVCCEVLEHLEEPLAGLDALARIADPWLLVSVPREPLWRVLNVCRGKYLANLGNTPGHVNHWSADGFLKLLATRFQIVAHRRPLPWTMALCRRR
ncbi:MAG: methyltransferase domain-containing protein [Xanthomonadales bacterium]|nr:Ubiquinone biosynthesis O-methyltransferase [Xanthomonadales bacterium]MCC6592252.1 methyltransferase domain-containing protein [Xanthomonadales bacterium]MCE7930682.1 methyltransferase domain-containing protein [Xanthomonadales bacterium PRO6]